MELLSPVKNYQTAKGVIQTGCDAIYFSSMSFGARVNASLDYEEIVKIVEYANKYKVKSYVTFNIVILDEEVEIFLSEIDQLYQCGIDGIILQDFSFIDLIKKNYPDLEVHCSTQMHVTNVFATKLVQTLGSNRIVVAREMQYENIRTIKDATNIEIEAFVHGALCVSYSGQCYDSTLLDQKSANRGRCSQYCRMPQKIINKRTQKVVSKGQYPLSLKDLNNIENLDKYLASGVDSLKIEGRLKELSYALEVTKQYRMALSGEKISKDSLRVVYNRDFTTGRISGVNGEALVNYNKQNNNGSKIGTVISCDLNTNLIYRFYKYIITIDTKNILHKLDNIRFLDGDFEDGQVIDVFSDENNQSFYSNINVKSGSLVYRTQNKELNDMLSTYPMKYERKINIEIDLIITNKVCFKINGQIFNSSINVQVAKNSPILKVKVIEKLNKTKDTPYNICIKDFIYSEDMFINLSDLTILKNEILNIYEKLNSKNRESNLISIDRKNLNKCMDDIKYYFEVQTLEQYNVVKTMDGVEIIIGSLALAKKINTQTDIIATPRVIYDNEWDEVDEIVSTYQRVCVSDLGALNRYVDKKYVMTNYTFNTTNLINQEKLVSLGVKDTMLSIELNFEHYKKFNNKHSIVNIYGKVPVMLMDYCPINLQKTNKCGNCRRCHNGDYYLVDNYQREFLLLYESMGRMSMYSNDCVNLLDKVDNFKAIGINQFHIRLTNENIEQVLLIKDAIKNGSSLGKGNYFNGNYYKKIL